MDEKNSIRGSQLFNFIYSSFRLASNIMSIICEEVKSSPYVHRGISGYVRATIDPTTANQLPFPSDYKFFSCVLPKKYLQWAKRIQDFKVRTDDIFILGLQKTGKRILNKNTCI